MRCSPSELGASERSMGNKDKSHRSKADQLRLAEFHANKAREMFEQELISLEAKRGELLAKMLAVGMHPAVMPATTTTSAKKSTVLPVSRNGRKPAPDEHASDCLAVTNALRKRPDISVSVLAKVAKIPQYRAAHALRSLRESGRASIKGRNRGAVWRLTDAGMQQPTNGLGRVELSRLVERIRK